MATGPSSFDGASARLLRAASPRRGEDLAPADRARSSMRPSCARATARLRRASPRAGARSSAFRKRPTASSCRPGLRPPGPRGRSRGRDRGARASPPADSASAASGPAPGSAARCARLVQALALLGSRASPRRRPGAPAAKRPRSGSSRTPRWLCGSGSSGLSARPPSPRSPALRRTRPASARATARSCQATASPGALLTGPAPSTPPPRGRVRCGAGTPPGPPKHRVLGIARSTRAPQRRQAGVPARPWPPPRWRPRRPGTRRRASLGSRSAASSATGGAGAAT